MESLTKLRLIMLLTFLLIFGTLFVFLSVVTLIMDAPVWLSVILAVFFVAIQWYVSPWIIERVARVRYLAPGEEPWLEETVRELARAAQVPMPRLAIVPDPSPNAFVFGRTKGDSRLAVHEGLLRMLNKDEIRAVLAHEIGHIKHNDSVMMTVVSAVPLVAYMLARSFFSGMRRGRRSSAALILALALISYLVYLFSQLLVMWFSRTREYYADAHSAYATGNPSALSSALSKITYGLSLYRGEPSGLRSFYIGDPASAKHEIGDIMKHKEEYDLDKDGVLDEHELQAAMKEEASSLWTRINELFSTHPSTYKRILFLKNIEKEMRTGS